MAAHRGGKRVASASERKALSAARAARAAAATSSTTDAAAPLAREAAPSRSAASSAGKRKAAKPARRAPRPSPLSKPSLPSLAAVRGTFALPSLPTVAGAAAVVVAAAGAVTVSSGHADPVLASGSISRLAGQANVLNGATEVGINDPQRTRRQAASRDSARQAQADAAGQELTEAAYAQYRQRNAALAKLRVAAENYAGEVAKNAWQLPLPLGSYRLSSRFGECSALWSNCHTGLDLAAPSGTPIYSIANGVVTETGYDGSYGNKTVVTLEDGTEIWYCHQTTIDVSVGQTVVGGQTIGTVGSTGNSTGPHLHLEVRPGAGDPVDPYGALLARSVQP